MNAKDKQKMILCSVSVSQSLSCVEGDLEFVEDLHTRLTEAFDAKSERWQESDKGQEASEEVERIGSIKDDLESARDLLSNIFAAMEELE